MTEREYVAGLFPARRRAAAKDQKSVGRRYSSAIGSSPRVLPEKSSLRAAANDSLGRMYDKLSEVEKFLTTTDKLNELGKTINPELRQQFQLAIEPMREAMNGDSWNEIEKQDQQLKKSVYFSEMSEIWLVLPCQS